MEDNRLKMKSVLQFLLLIVLGTGLFLLIMYQGGRLPYFLFFTMMPILLYVAFFYLYPTRYIDVKQEVVLKHEFSNEVTINTEVVLPFPMPLFFVGVNSILPERLGETTGEIQFLFLKKKFKKTVHLNDVLRGDYELKQVLVQIWDIFGFFHRSIYKSVSNQFLVYPMYKKIALQDIEHLTEQGLNMSHHNRLDHQVVVGNREYQRGDRFSWIDWKASARKQELVTKEFSDAKENEIQILMDCNSASCFEGVVSTTMSLVVACHKDSLPFQWKGDGSEFPSVLHGGRTTPMERKHLYGVLSVLSPKFNSSLLDQLKQRKENGTFFSSLIVTSNLSTDLLKALGYYGLSKSTHIYYVYDKNSTDNESLGKVLNAAKLYKIDVIPVEVVHNRIQKIGGK